MKNDRSVSKTKTTQQKAQDTKADQLDKLANLDEVDFEFVAGGSESDSRVAESRAFLLMQYIPIM